MLLNEVQLQHREIEALKAQVLRMEALIHKQQTTTEQRR
jgi:hypothetical protein